LTPEVSKDSTDQPSVAGVRTCPASGCSTAESKQPASFPARFR